MGDLFYGHQLEYPSCQHGVKPHTVHKEKAGREEGRTWALMQALRAHTEQPDLYLIPRHKILLWKKVGEHYCCAELPPMKQDPAAEPFSQCCFASSCN